MPLNDFEFTKWSWTMLMIPIGWIVKMQWSHKHDCDIQHKEHVEHRGYVAQYYVQKAEFHIMDERIFRILQRIEDKIDRKADK